MTDYDFNYSEYGGDSINGNFAGGYLENSFVQPSTPNFKSNNNNNNNNNTFSSREQCLLPLEISQINNAKIEPDEPFKIDGIETSNVTIIAQIQNIKKESITTTVTVKDNTGELDVKIWESEQKDQEFDQLLKIGTTVRIIGRMKIFRNNISLQCYKVLSVVNDNEVKLHRLEAQYAHEYNSQNIQETPFWIEMYNKKKDENGNQNNNNNNNINMNSSQNNNNGVRNMFSDENMSNNSAKNTTTNSSVNGSISNSSGNNLSQSAIINNSGVNWNASEELRGLNQLQRLLFVKIRQLNQTEEGCGLDLLVETYKNNNIDSIRDGIEHLTNEGLVYTTMDEEHFKTTEY